MEVTRLIPAVVVGCVSVAAGLSATHAEDLKIADTPLSVVSIKPPVMVMLDNSGSMKNPMYQGGFNEQQSYYGIFDAGKNYVYDPTIPINTSAYSVDVSKGRPGAFVASDCTPSAANDTCWSGSFLNWFTTRRIDASRRVMVGGKTEGAGSYAYGGGKRYKIVGNNEPLDSKQVVIRRSSPVSAVYSPVPNGVTTDVYSPADKNNGAQQASYNPYAQIGFTPDNRIYDEAGNVIGELGRQTTDAAGVERVEFSRTYNDPIVVAKSITAKGSDPTLLRMMDVGPNGVGMRLQEWKYVSSPGHRNEDVTWLVMERGAHTLPGGLEVVADRLKTNETVDSGTCGPRDTSFASVSFSRRFNTTPSVITAVTTYNGTDPVVTRLRDVGSGGFDVALQEEEAGGGHIEENIDYIAFERGTKTGPEGLQVEAGVAAIADDGDLADGGGRIDFAADFSSAPLLLSDMQTTRAYGTATLREESVSNTGARVHIEEETSCDNERTHPTEDVGYVALQVKKRFNLALAVGNKPSGLLQDVADEVRLGISFYRYDPSSSNIYDGNYKHGGTLQFQIPKNPFVAAPSAAAQSGKSHAPGYRELDGYVGGDINDIVDAVQNYPLSFGTTAIAESLWEVIQYFEQDDPYYDAEDPVAAARDDFIKADQSNPERDPFYYPGYEETLYCTNPSTIVFTDGRPVHDGYIPPFLEDYDDDGAGEDETSTQRLTQGRDNADDVAKWGYCDKSTGSCDGGTRDLRGDLRQDQSLTVQTVGFANGGTIRQILQDTADNAGGTAYAAEDGAALENALRSAFQGTRSRASVSSVAVNTTRITEGSFVYQTVFNSNTWDGDLEAHKINLDGTIAASAEWRAAEQLPAPTARTIVTANASGSGGAPFRWDQLGGAQQGAIGSEAVLDYIRGEDDDEQSQGGTFRDRQILLGDIVNAAPQWVGPPASRYRPDDLESTLHSTFRDTYQDRAPIVYAGANEGMLHAFDAGSGEEVFAYVPGMLFPKLGELTKPDYTHEFFADGAPTIEDAFFGSDWHTVLVAGLRGGGQGVYALDITDPSAFNSEGSAVDTVLWEIDDGDTPANGLGYTFSRPDIVRLENGKWVAIFGNGYNNTEADGTASANGNAYLYVVDLATGNILKTFDTGEGTGDDPNGDSRPNGLATVAPVDVDGDGITEYAYAGDLFGNMWKFDLRDDESAWTIANGGEPIFSACSATPCNNLQPITTAPQVARHPSQGGYMVYFGTGKYFETGDQLPGGQSTQSFYGIWDRADDTATTVTRSQLLQQKILAELDEDGDGIDDYRGISDNPIDWDEHSGWYLDLVNTEDGNTTNNKGERQISEAVLRDDVVLFTTMQPSQEACAGGGSGWLMALDMRSGGRLAESPFNVNSDDNFDKDDRRQYDANDDGTTGSDELAVLAGTRIPNATGSAATLINGASEDGSDFALNTTGSGPIWPTEVNPFDRTGRRSWQQLR